MVDPTAPEFVDRDRFVLSGGHGSMLLYSLLHLSGFDLPLADLKNFSTNSHSKTPGHPGEHAHRRRRDHDRAARSGRRQRGRDGAR